MQVKVKLVPFNRTPEYKKVKARVQKGIKFLDKTYGDRSWLKEVKTKILQMGDGYTCVIGQVFGAWGSKVTSEAAVHNGYILTEMQAARFGFQSQRVAREKTRGEGEFNHAKNQKEYDNLQYVWKETLKRLKTKKKK